MPKFIVERNTGPLTQAQMEGALREAMKVADDLQVKWVRSYYAAEEGKMYCEYEAPSAELLLDHARRVGVPADGIRMVSELLPSMFR
jgi:hypothetical protein